ncbi:RHS repeat-associated core domain-containing protein [Halomonas sp. DP5N14-9]|nr:RHS repeat-associated core domain-containing protein [Halomonas sp. DP5N14-9]
MELAECGGKSSGKLAWVGHYRAWGKLTQASDGHGNPSTTDNPLRFQGQYLDEETGLHYNRHRYYDPETGRFTTQDPIGLAGGENLYMYAPNPTGWLDPLGLSNKCCNCLYRGVSASHPALDEAKKGIVRPANPNATLSPEEHARGGVILPTNSGHLLRRAHPPLPLRRWRRPDRASRRRAGHHLHP